MHLQHESMFLHCLEHPREPAQIGNARVRVGGRTRRVKLGAVDIRRVAGGFDILHTGIVREVERHQRFEVAVCRQRRENPFAIGQRIFAAAHRGNQIGHDDRAPELSRTVGDDGLQVGGVTQMQMPIIGSDDGQTIHLLQY